MKKAIIVILMCFLCSTAWGMPKRVISETARLELREERQEKENLLKRIEELEKEIQRLKERISALEQSK